jgi:hypothetical protein
MFITPASLTDERMFLQRSVKVIPSSCTVAYTALQMYHVRAKERNGKIVGTCTYEASSSFEDFKRKSGIQLKPFGNGAEFQQMCRKL